MNVVVLGSKGMLGTDLEAACRQAGMTTQGLDRPMFEITDPDALSGLLAPGSVVINCAAYTGWTTRRPTATSPTAVNAAGAGLAGPGLLRARHCRLIHISTDYVFDGRERTGPTARTTRPIPLSVYGASKLEGERRVAEAGRLTWLCGCSPFRAARATTSCASHPPQRLPAGPSRVRVVDDQVSFTDLHPAPGPGAAGSGPSPRTRAVVHVAASGHPAAGSSLPWPSRGPSARRSGSSPSPAPPFPPRPGVRRLGPCLTPALPGLDRPGPAGLAAGLATSTCEEEESDVMKTARHRRRRIHRQQLRPLRARRSTPTSRS